MRLSVYFLPELADPAELPGATVVVADILRATTTMLHALRSGATCVIPCLEIDEAQRMASHSPGSALLGGERGGTRIDGFHLGNSPAEFTPAIVGGKTVVMTTTNGTRALRKCSSAARVLIGAFANFSRLIAELSPCEKVVVICAGTNGHITGEDVVFAGGLVNELRRRTADRCELNDEARLAAAAWESLVGGLAHLDRLFRVLRDSRGGRNLVELGFENDIRLAASIDTVPVIGELLRDGRVVKR